MEKAKKDRLEAAGWRVGGAEEFLGLAPEERAFLEIKLALSAYLRASRAERGWTQTQVARRIDSSQSRVAKMEAGDPSISLDWLVQACLALGVPREEIAGVIAGAA